MKETIAKLYDRASLDYGEKDCSYFGYFGKRLVEISNIKSSDNILDVATGTGSVILPLKKHLKEGDVIGIDISEKMLEKCQMKAKKIGYELDLRVMDAENLEFEDNSFDFIFCGFAIFFFPDLTKALSEFKRVLKVDGRVAFSIWGEKPHLEAWASERALEMGASNKLTSKSMSYKKTIFDILNNAKFRDISILEESKDFYHESAEEWWQSLMAHGTRYFLEQLSAEQLKSLYLEAIKKANESAVSGKIKQKFQVFYAVAKNFKS